MTPTDYRITRARVIQGRASVQETGVFIASLEDEIMELRNRAAALEIEATDMHRELVQLVNRTDR